MARVTKHHRGKWRRAKPLDRLFDASLVDYLLPHVKDAMENIGEVSLDTIEVDNDDTRVEAIVTRTTRVFASNANSSRQR